MEENETTKELIREWRRKLRSGLYDNPGVDWGQIHDVEDSMTAFLGEGPDVFE